MCGFAQMAPPDLDPSSCGIPIFVKNTRVVVITWSPFRSILDCFLFSLSFMMCAHCRRHCEISSFGSILGFSFPPKISVLVGYDSIRFSRWRCVFFVRNLVPTSASCFCVATWWMVIYPSLTSSFKRKNRALCFVRKL